MQLCLGEISGVKLCHRHRRVAQLPVGIISELDGHIEHLVASHVDGLFPQGDDDNGAFSIFTHRLPPEKRSHYLQLLTDDPDYFPGSVIMEELAHRFEDPDGMFIRAMQGNEFTRGSLSYTYMPCFMSLTSNPTAPIRTPITCFPRLGNPLLWRL